MKDIDKGDAPLWYVAVAASRNHHCGECDMFYTCLTYSKKCGVPVNCWLVERKLFDEEQI